MNDRNSADEQPLREPTLDDIDHAHGPMSSMLNQDETASTVDLEGRIDVNPRPDDTPQPKTQRSIPDANQRANAGLNRAQRRASHKKKPIGPESIRQQTEDRIKNSEREKRVKELPVDLQNLIDRITKPEALARTKDIPLHQWKRSDTLDMFVTFARVHAQMMAPVAVDGDDDVPEQIKLMQIESSLGIFYPVTEDSASNIIITVNDPRHYLSAAERDLTNDVALNALAELAEKIITGLYSLAGSLLPGSYSHEIAGLMSQLEEVQINQPDYPKDDVTND